MLLSPPFYAFLVNKKAGFFGVARFAFFLSEGVSGAAKLPLTLSDGGLNQVGRKMQD